MPTMPKEISIAITGTIGSGKSSVSRIIRKLGFYVFDCDAYNNELLNDIKTIDFIKKEFDCVKDNKIDKKELAKIIFNDSSKKELLENYLHPLIINKMNEEKIKYHPYFAEVPLLFEKNLEYLFDYSILVVSNDENIKNRLKRKGYQDNEIIERINNQMSVNEKEKRADKIIYNVYGLKELEENTKTTLKELGC